MSTASVSANELNAWDRVQIARHSQRPHTLDYVLSQCEDFTELHGDRRFGDDPAMVSGLATLDGVAIAIVGHQKGRNTRENLHRRFGMPRPEGYRKALRMFRHAEKFGLPLICFIDTPGASPDMESEERGQANAIAECIIAMADLRTPILGCVIGEGGSGGALAIGVADRLIMLENSIYSVVSPEGCASILWRDASKAPDAAAAMRITAHDMRELGIADAIIPEPEGGAHSDTAVTIAVMGDALRQHLRELVQYDLETLLAQRYDRYRRIGRFQEHQQQMLNHSPGAVSASLSLPFT